MFFLKSKSKKINLIIISVFLTGCLFMGITRDNNSLSTDRQDCNHPKVVEANVAWEPDSGIFCIHFGDGGETSYGKVTLFGFVLWNGENHK